MVRLDGLDVVDGVDVNGLDVLDDTGTHTQSPDVSLLVSKPLAQFKLHNGPIVDVNGLDVEDPPGCKVVDVVG